MTSEQIALITSGCGLLVLWVGWIKAVRPKVRRGLARLNAMLDVFVGRDEVPDVASGTTLPAVTALPERLNKIENTLDRVAVVLEKLADHERRIGLLEAGILDRASIRMENAALLNAVAHRNDEIYDVPSTEGEDQTT